jgi:hypothetical protein
MIQSHITSLYNSLILVDSLQILVQIGIMSWLSNSWNAITKKMKLLCITATSGEHTWNEAAYPEREREREREREFSNQPTRIFPHQLCMSPHAYSTTITNDSRIGSLSSFRPKLTDFVTTWRHGIQKKVFRAQLTAHHLTGLVHQGNVSVVSSPIYAQIPWGEKFFNIADYGSWWPDKVLHLNLCWFLCKCKGNMVSIATGQS